MTGYTNANGDDRGVLDRYLPTPYRKIGSGTEVHNAFLGAIRNSIITTEKDLVDNVKQVYINNATGKLLDLYGKWIGLSRRSNEQDVDYRKRLLDLIVTERVTIKGIISGIKSELNDPELDVSIYEPWRNIFVLNRSLLNGPDHIMGDFYRYAVIQVTLSKFVPQDTLMSILLKYKAAGIKVYFVLSTGMQFGNEVFSLPISLIGHGEISISTDKFIEKYSMSINDLPTGTLNKGIFTTNVSDLNSTDVLAGSPENTYAYQYGTVPSKNIFGVVPEGANPSSYTDPYDYVYQNTKVDLSTVGGRNLLLGTNSKSGFFMGTGNGSYTTSYVPFEYGYKWSIKTESAATNYSYVQNSGLRVSNFSSDTDYVISFMINTNVDFTPGIYFMTGAASGNFVTQIDKPKILAKSGDQRVSINLHTYTTIPADIGQTLYINGFVNLNANITFWDLKIESSSNTTDWTPAPEDTPKTYIYPYKNTSYVNMGRKDSIYETLTGIKGNKAVFAFDIKDYLIANGYQDKISGFNQSSETGIILSTFGSPYGISQTSLVAKSRTDSSVLKGTWYEYTSGSIGRSIGSYIPKSSTSSSSYIYKLDNPADIGTIEFSDYYNQSGATRSVEIFDGTNKVRVLTTDEQTLGTISLPTLTMLNETIISAYIKSIKYDFGSVPYNFYIYDYVNSKWRNIDSNTDMSPYLKSGDITSGIYLLVGSDYQGELTIDYAGMDIECYL